MIYSVQCFLILQLAACFYCLNDLINDVIKIYLRNKNNLLNDNSLIDNLVKLKQFQIFNIERKELCRYPKNTYIIIIYLIPYHITNFYLSDPFQFWPFQNVTT